MSLILAVFTFLVLFWKRQGLVNNYLYIHKSLYRNFLWNASNHFQYLGNTLHDLDVTLHQRWTYYIFVKQILLWGLLSDTLLNEHELFCSFFSFHAESFEQSIIWSRSVSTPATCSYLTLCSFNCSPKPKSPLKRLWLKFRRMWQRS